MEGANLTYSCVHNILDIFQDSESEETIPSAKIDNTSYGMKQKEIWKTQQSKNVIFQL